jgi:methylmalonyl-CoA mutase N-terminal domain/subunit
VVDRYHARAASSARFRAGVVCGGSTLQAPQPWNNVVRVAYQALASVLGGVQSMFTAAWDEPFALPTEESATLALRTQQILAYETGVARVVDPLGGSYYVEALTDEMEARIVAIMEDLEAHGGMVAAIESGYVQRLIADEAYRAAREVERGERVVVGVNRFTTDDPVPDVRGYEFDEAGRERQLRRLAEVRRSRSARAVSEALRAVEAAARRDDNLMPLLVDAVEAYCTIGEIVRTLKDVWGEFQEPAVF